MSYKPTFDAEKSVAATAYLAHGTGESMYPILKMLYLVDKCHLERYGRPVTGDRHVAFKEGPAPSAIYDLMKFLRGEHQYSDYSEARDFLNVNATTHAVTVVKMPDLDVLSPSDLECLDEILALYREKGKWHVIDVSHDEAWKATSRNGFMDIKTIAAACEGGPVLIQHLAERFPDAA